MGPEIRKNGQEGTGPALGAVAVVGVLAMVLASAVGAVALMAGMAWAGTLLGPFRAVASSMAPNVETGDVFFVDPSFGTDPDVDVTNLAAYAETAPMRGDVVLFTAGPARLYFVKRVIGLPSETIELRGGVVHLDGQPVALDDTGETHALETAIEGAVEVDVQRETLPNGRSYRVLNASDAGPGDDVGPFLVPDGHYFVMGDNRDNSADSRFDYSHIGMVPREAMVGKLASILYAADGRDPTSSELFAD